MNPRSRGLGWAALVILVACFLVLRPVFEAALGDSAEAMREHLNGAVTAIAGLLTIGVATVLDKKSGLDVFSKRAWTSDIMESQHVLFYLPLRLVGMIMIVASFFF